ncbi:MULTISPECIES: 2-oxo acid dehydrogenase subunit E2 [unclassified Streptomyces]|uniref:dihydrolipoamide acetyltransferase family protein n=1 Tax=unclassified Streptomyces TaxID=2593676 RepID=UPI003815FCEF
MADIIRMPEVLAGAEEASIQTWLVAPGDTVTVHQPLAELETDKALVELTAETDGVIGCFLATVGDKVAVGDPVLVMLAPGETDEHLREALSEHGLSTPSGPTAAPGEPEAAASSGPAASPRPDQAAATPAAAAAPPTSGAPTPQPGDRRLFSSPLVRRLAAQNDVSLEDVKGTGPNGRIVRRDLEAHLARTRHSAPRTSAEPEPESEPVSEPEPRPRSESPTVAASKVTSTPPPAVGAPPSTAGQEQPTAGTPFRDVPIDRMRGAIARRLTDSKSSVPHFYLVADCRVDALLELRRTVNESAPRKISLNDFVVKAVAAALVEVPVANAIWNGDSIRCFSSADISVAVATESGLTTPVLRSVESLSLTRVSATMADLAERARAGRLRQHELTGGSFTVSNLGMYGTSEFTAILNPPQSGILAVGAVRAAPIVDQEDRLVAGHVMTVTLSADHRVLDGAVAAQWLAAFRRHIENPLTILA